MNNNHFAEVIESSLHAFKAQCWQWDRPPTFGSLVAVQDGTKTIFALVAQSEMGSMDPVHYPFPYQKTQEELRSEQPQIFEFLKTTFSGLIVGCREKGRITYLAPNTPPKIHAFVETVSGDLAREFFASSAYLHLVFASVQHMLSVDEFLLAVLHHHVDACLVSEQSLHEFLETFSLLTGNDYRRLKLFLQRIQPLYERKSL
ncbi:hypothetical protein KJZ61_01535 [Candidatus Dependentiae bacterium]|nr:hypothetical protein [Candidatus Dependentiae bacterium]